MAKVVHFIGLLIGRVVIRKTRATGSPLLPDSKEREENG